MLPSSPDGTEMDQLTVPPWAVSVNELPPPTASAMFVVDTLSVPAAAGDPDPEDGDELADEDGDELADPAEPDDDVVGEADADVVALPPVARADGDAAPYDAADDAGDTDPLPCETGTDVPPDVGSADGLPDRDAPLPGRSTTAFACVPVVYAPVAWADGPIVTLADEAASGITAVIGVDGPPPEPAATW